MPYREEIFEYTEGREVKKYHTPRLGGKKTRLPNYNPTPDDVKKVNQKRREEKLRRIILTNFKRDDVYLTLTYAKEPESYKEAKKKLSKFLRTLRRKYRKAGKELKYIYTTESRGKRIHHHLLLNYENGVCSRELVQECWKEGIINYYAYLHYDGGTEDARRMASYLIKETGRSIREGDQKVSYVPSRNLKKPKVYYRTIQSKSWKEKPIPPKGMELYEIINTYTNEGYPLQIARYRKRGRQNE